jgi:hypothetical protein
MHTSRKDTKNAVAINPTPASVSLISDPRQADGTNPAPGGRI